MAHARKVSTKGTNSFVRATANYSLYTQEIANKANNPTTRAKKDTSGVTGAWPPQVSIQRAAWNSGNGLRAAPFLVSSTGSGLCRVDWLLGRWNKDRIPYSSVEGIRGEVAIDAREDEDED